MSHLNKITISNEPNILKACLHDMENYDPTAAVCGIIMLDLNKRERNRQNTISTHVIAGDDLQDAINNFKETDESSGLYDSDFKPPVLTMAFLNEQ